MSNPEMNDLNEPEMHIHALFEEMLGSTFTESKEYDQVAKISTEWTTRNDGMYYARRDISDSGTLERFIRDDQQYGSRDNFISEKKEDGSIIVVGYSREEATTLEQFALKITAGKVLFKAIYASEGAWLGLEIKPEELSSPIEEDTSEKSPDENLSKIIDLYQLKGTSAFEPALLGDLGNEIDLSGDTPKFTLGTWLIPMRISKPLWLSRLYLSDII